MRKIGVRKGTENQLYLFSILPQASIENEPGNVYGFISSFR